MSGSLPSAEKGPASTSAAASIPPETADRVAYVAELARRRMIQMGFLRVYASVPARYAFTVSG